MTLKNNRAPRLCCFNLCASLHSQWWIKTGVTIRKHSIRVKIGNFLSHVTLKFDGWPWKTIGNLFYTMSSFVHFKAISLFKLELQSGNAQFGSIDDFLSRVTLKFDGLHWKIIGHLFYTTLSFAHNFEAISEFKLELQSRNTQFGSKSRIFFVPCDLEIWWMTLKNSRAPLEYYIRLCASFQSHWWILTGVTVRKVSIWVKIDNFLFRVTLKFDEGPWKTTGNLFWTMSSLVHHFKAISAFKLELQSGIALFESKSAIVCPLWPWNLTDDLEK